MGLLSSFDTNRDEFNTGSGIGKLIIDLSSFIIGGTPIGNVPWDGDFFAKTLCKDNTFEPPGGGYTLACESGLLNDAFITLAEFQGVFLIKNNVSPLTTKTTKEEIITLFDQPYWTDIDDDEVILFYEYRHGKIELQFEFTDGQHLSFITLTKDGVLSDEGQRKSYGVTKEWPPT